MAGMQPTRAEIVATLAAVWLEPADFRASVAGLCHEALCCQLFGPPLALVLSLSLSSTRRRPRWRIGALAPTGGETSSEDEEEELSSEFWATGAAFEGRDDAAVDATDDVDDEWELELWNRDIERLRRAREADLCEPAPIRCEEEVSSEPSEAILVLSSCEEAGSLCDEAESVSDDERELEL